MLRAGSHLVDALFVDDLRFDLEGSELVFLLAVEQHVVHAETPGIEIGAVPTQGELRPCSNLIDLVLQRDPLYAFQVNVLLDKSWLWRHLFLHRLGVRLHCDVLVVLGLDDLSFLLWFRLFCLDQFLNGLPLRQDWLRIQIHLLLYFLRQFVLFFRIRVDVDIILSQSKLSVIILSAAVQFSGLSKEDGEIGASSHFFNIEFAYLLDLNWIGVLLIVIDTQLSMFIESPRVIGKAIAFLDLCNCVIPTAPDIQYMVESHAVEQQTAREFVSFVDPASHCVSFRLSTNEYFACYKNGSVVAARDQFLYGISLQTGVNVGQIVLLRHFYRLNHLLSSQELVVA